MTCIEIGLVMLLSSKLCGCPQLDSAALLKAIDFKAYRI